MEEVTYLEVLQELDMLAMEVCKYEYGLPLHNDEFQSKAKQIIEQYVLDRIEMREFK